MSSPQESFDENPEDLPPTKDGERGDPEEAWNPEEFLNNLTDYIQNPKGCKYRTMIEVLREKDKFQRFGTSFAIHWQAMLKSGTEQNQLQIQMLLEKVSGKTVVDLGGGYTLDDNGTAPSVMQGVVERLGTKVYVNADRFFPGYERRSRIIRDITKVLGIEQPEKMKVIYTYGDILDFLARIPSEFPDLVLVLNGIDENLIPRRVPGWDPQYSNYHEMVADEIARVLPKGGVVLTMGSDSITKHFKDKDFEVAPGYTTEKGAMFEKQVWIKK